MLKHKGARCLPDLLGDHSESLPVLVIYKRVASNIDLFSVLSSDSFPYKRISFKYEGVGCKFNFKMTGLTVSIKRCLWVLNMGQESKNCSVVSAPVAQEQVGLGVFSNLCLNL